MTVIDRFLKLVSYPTTSDENSETCPSTPRQLALAEELVRQMQEMGIADAHVDADGYVYGTIPANCEKDIPVYGLIAHMDTAPDASGENVNPILHENYDGHDVTLPATGMVMKVSTFPFLKDLKGETLITTDGTTLLGADDKAGVAEILTAAETLIAEGRPHGKLCIAFTPDEEIGEGASLFDIPGFGADFAYTVDGGDVGGIEYENFNAASATVTVHGFSVHPGSAKDAMINASNVAMEFHQALPVMARPETTEGRQGFYHLCQMYGDVTEAKLGYILRDHDAGKLQFKKDNLLHIACYLNGKYGDGTVEVEIKDSYRNMIEKIKPHFHLVENARKAIEKAGLTPEEIDYLGKTGAGVTKASRRDLPILVAEKRDGATTVTTTMMIAAMAGIEVFATGGIGGVHRGAETTMDISADLEELAQTPVMVVCAGAKSILDLGLTLEYLETHGVPVIGYQTEELPAFYTRKSGFGVDYRLDTPAQLAEAFHVKRELGLRGGMLVTNPIPEAYSMDADVINKAIDEAVEEAKEQGIHGKATTPFLLAKIKDITGGSSLDANIQLVYNNARLAAATAVELAKLRKAD